MMTVFQRCASAQWQCSPFLWVYQKDKRVKEMLIVSVFLYFCSSANDYLGCVYTEVHRTCNREAADWQRGFDDVLIQPLLRLVGCESRMYQELKEENDGPQHAWNISSVI